MIRRCTLDRTIDAVRRTGIHRDLEATLNPGGTGRPRQLRIDVFLAGVLLTVGDKRPLTLVNVHGTLTKNLALSARIALGTEYRPSPEASPRSLSVRQVRYLLEAIERRLAYTEGRCPDLAPEDREARAGALQHVLDKVIEASLPERLPRPASLALDGTGLESWARGKKRPTGAASATSDPATGKTSNGSEENGLDAIGGEGYSFDPDARWGDRTRTYDNKSTKCFGYELYNLVGVPGLREDPSALPKLTYALTLRPLATDVVEPGLTLLDRLTARRHSVRELLNDRAWSYIVAERWAEQLRRRGIDQVFDLHPSDRGVRDFEGITMIDGAPHCRAVLDEQAARHDLTVDDLAVINGRSRWSSDRRARRHPQRSWSTTRRRSGSSRSSTQRSPFASSPPSGASRTPGRRRRTRARNAGSARHKRARWSVPTVRPQHCYPKGRRRSSTHPRRRRRPSAAPSARSPSRARSPRSSARRCTGEAPSGSSPTPGAPTSKASSAT